MMHWFCFVTQDLRLDPHMLWDGLVGAIGGGAVSSLITIASERKSKRTDVALDIMEKFMAQYEALGTVLGFLNAPACLSDATKMNGVRKMGDWYEIVAAVSLENKADVALLRRLTIPALMRNFLSSARQAANSNRDLEEAIKSWTNLQEFVAKEGTHE